MTADQGEGRVAVGAGEADASSQRQVWLQILLGPGRFWLGVAISLFVVGSVTYTYGAWYAAVLAMDAVPVREIQERASWTGRFDYREVADGLRVRVRRPAPETLDALFSVERLDELELADAGYSRRSGAGGASGAGDGEEGTPEEGEAKPFDRSEFIQAMRETGILTGEEVAQGRTHTVIVDEFADAGSAREAAQRLRELGRDVALQEVRGGDGRVRYRLESGSFDSREAAEAYQRELEAAGLMPGSGAAPSTGGETPPPVGGGGSTTGGTEPPPGTGPEPPAPAEGTSPAPSDPVTPAPPDPSPPEQSGAGRALGDL